MFSLANQSSMMHSFVDSFFEAKKAQVKEQLMDSMKTIVDNLFNEMVGQVKEMLLPPKENKKPEVKKQAISHTFKSNFYETKQDFVSGQKRAFSENDDNPEMVSNQSVKKVKKNLLDEFNQVEDQEFGGDNDDFDYQDKNEETELFSEETSFAEKYGNVLVEFDDGTTKSSTFTTGKTTKPQKSTSKPAIENKTEKKFKCTEEGCDKSFAKEYNLKVHINSVHKKVKPYVCSFDPDNCTFASGHRSNTIAHIRDHLKKAAKKPGTSTEEGESSEPPDQDPAKYLTVKKELL